MVEQHRVILVTPTTAASLRSLNRKLQQTTLRESRKTDTMYDSQSFTRVGLMKGHVVFAYSTKMSKIHQQLAQNFIAQWVFLILTAGGDVRTKLQSGA